MADFCRHCSLAIFQSDTRDLAELMPADRYTEDTGALALCECCGPIVVDINGKRISEYDPQCTCEEPANLGEPDPTTPATDHRSYSMRLALAIILQSVALFFAWLAAPWSMISAGMLSILVLCLRVRVTAAVPPASGHPWGEL